MKGFPFKKSAAGLAIVMTCAALRPAASSPARGSVEDRLAALEARNVALQAELLAVKAPTRKAVAPTLAATAAPFVLTHPGLALIGGPLIGAVPVLASGFSGGSFSGGTVANATTFTGDVTLNGGVGALGFGAGETLVPADGTLNVTGKLTATDTITSSQLFASTGYQLTDSNTQITETGTNDLALTADGAVVGTFSSTGLAIANITATNPVTINGWKEETDYLTADFVATDTTPLDVTGISFAMEVNDVYSVSCSGRAFTALATAGEQPGFDVPSGATIAASCTHPDNTSGFFARQITADDGTCAFANAVLVPGGILTIEATVTMSTTAGNTNLRLRSETTDDVTIAAGFRCTATKIVDN